MFLLREGILDDKGINQLEKEVEAELQIAVDRALEALPPAPESVTQLCLLARPRSDLQSTFDTQPCSPSPSAMARSRRAKPWPT